MTNIEKFYADMQRIQKHDRADNGGRYDGVRASEAIAKLFAASNRGMGALPESITEYWIEKKIKCSENIDEEPSQENKDWLAQVQELLDGTLQDASAINDDDWQEIKEIADCEAESIPIDILQSIMCAIMDHGAL